MNKKLLVLALAFGFAGVVRSGDEKPEEKETPLKKAETARDEAKAAYEAARLNAAMLFTAETTFAKAEEAAKVEIKAEKPAETAPAVPVEPAKDPNDATKYADAAAGDAFTKATAAKAEWDTKKAAYDAEVADRDAKAAALNVAADNLLAWAGVEGDDAAARKAAFEKKEEKATLKAAIEKAYHAVGEADGKLKGAEAEVAAINDGQGTWNPMKKESKPRRAVRKVADWTSKPVRWAYSKAPFVTVVVGTTGTVYLVNKSGVVQAVLNRFGLGDVADEEEADAAA